MAKTANAKGRRIQGSYVQIPHRVLDSENFIALSYKSKSLLLDLLSQYKGRNNGDLCAAMSIMKVRGWKSNETLATALEELQHFRLIVKTRQGGRHKASLYAITWMPIDDCRGKLDVQATLVAPGGWDDPRPAFCRKDRKRDCCTEQRFNVHRLPV